MAELLTDKDQPLHRAQQGDSLSTVARARTLTVLGRLDGGRKRSVLQFLYESGLIYTEEALLNESDLIEKRHNIVSLAPADLSEANLHAAILIRADLSGADLRGVLEWTEEQLSTAKTLEGAIMPDGRILKSDYRPDGPTFEEWLKGCEDRGGHKEDGENE